MSIPELPDNYRFRARPAAGADLVELFLEQKRPGSHNPPIWRKVFTSQYSHLNELEIRARLEHLWDNYKRSIRISPEAVRIADEINKASS